MYVFDTNVLSQMFHSYYKNRFKSLWAKFDEILEEERITSTREVFQETQGDRIPALREWAIENKAAIFPTPNADEAIWVSKIFSIGHFQHIIEQKKIMRGGFNADPFVIARAAALNGTVVTNEKHLRNGAKIPNICEHFEIPCLSLEGFMESEKWEF
jgi:hypothetical protein